MIRFWCEFPKEVNWEKFKERVKFKTEVYVAVGNRMEFDEWEKKIKDDKIDVGAWPVLNKEDGYWFSGFLSKELIDKLDEFKGLKVKVDIEPLFPGEGKNPWLFVLNYIFLNGENNEYLREKIENLSKKSEIIISGFPLPLFFRKRYGHFDFENVKRNYIAYTTFGRFLRLYYSWFIKRNESMFSIGCIGKGIFGNEPVYKNLEEFKRDLEWLRKLNVRDINVFSVSGIMKKDDKWFRVLELYSGV